VIKGGKEFHPVSTYEENEIVWVDLEPIDFEEEK
jgi:hypothetical protein